MTKSSSLLSSLNPAQHEAVVNCDGPSLIIAGPGSGKTRVLTHRVAYLISEKGVPAENILLLTFTNKAAAEMKERAQKLVGTLTRIPWSGTFHSVCSRILRKDGHAIGINPNFVIYDDDDAKTLIKKIIKDLNLDGKKTSEGAVKNAISSAKNELLGPADYINVARGYFQEIVAEVYKRYQQELKKCNALDFDDLINKTIELFRDDKTVLQKYHRQFLYVLVDEYQDTNHAQYILTRLLTGPSQNLCVVGDMAQAIYSFRGADSRNILSFEKDYPQSHIYKLSQNYRSTPQIITAAAALIKNNRQPLNLDLWTDNPSGLPINIYNALNERDESEFVIKKLEELEKLADSAILYRTNAQSRVIEEALLNHGLPYRLLGGTSFYDRAEVRDVLAYLRLIYNPLDSVSLDRIFKIGKKRADKFFQFLEEAKDIKDEPTLQILDAILAATNYLDLYAKADEENEDRKENVKELRSVASSFTKLGDFLESVTLLEHANKARNVENAVSLMTIHAAKGLEFKTVFIIGLEEGLFPHQRSLTDLSELEEERRLAYVGITRAKESLFLSHAQSRFYFGAHQINLPSRFLDEIPESLTTKEGNELLEKPKFKKALDDFMDDLDLDRLNF